MRQTKTTSPALKLSFAIWSLIAGCSTAPNSTTGPADKLEKATPAGPCSEVVTVEASTQAQAVQFVFEYVRKNYPGAKIRNKLLRGEDTGGEKRLYDVYELNLSDGTQNTICFDISATIAGYGRSAP